MIQLQSAPRERIAIIGTGISGLVCAHRLHADHDVTLFEANDWIGGHTHTVDVDLGDTTWAIDTGFIVFNELNYPNFVDLLSDLGVVSHPTTMSFSVKCDRTGLEYNGTSLNKLFAQRRNLLRPRFHRMIREILRFNREAPAVLDAPPSGQTVGEYLRLHDYDDAFGEHYLVPMGAAIWSCPARRFLDFPIRFVVEFMQHHVMLQVKGRPQWRVITGGSRTYVDAMIQPFRDRIRLSTPVLGVRRGPDGVDVVTGRDRVERFDEVIFACHSDQALALLQDADDLEETLLGSFPYQRNEAVLHTDTSLLPRRRLAWAAWNYHLAADAEEAATVTYNMNMLQGLRAPETFCVTLNESALIDPARVIARFTYEHPVFTTRRDAAQARHREVIRRRRTSFCGAYWGYGFHEDGVRSGLAVSSAFERVPV
jgi:predicted NAD/FAD-binding protein